MWLQRQLHQEGILAGEALFIGWGAVARGREKQAIQVFQERLIARASAIIDSLGVIPAYGGDAVAQRIGLLQEVADDFGG